mmetsp:Transcript_38424/g.69650  ORF Transcript_38424/g.69650 Transcript_38424/m.69650 type:complete len:258 (-) Transcript_38424:2180-2953(-)
MRWGFAIDRSWLPLAVDSSISVATFPTSSIRLLATSTARQGAAMRGSRDTRWAAARATASMPDVRSAVEAAPPSGSSTSTASAHALIRHAESTSGLPLPAARATAYRRLSARGRGRFTGPLSLSQACSTAFAFVPPKPKPLTLPATPSEAEAAMSLSHSVITETATSSQFMCWLRWRRCRDGGIIDCCRTIINFVSEAAPAAHSKCPMLDLKLVVRIGGKAAKVGSPIPPPRPRRARPSATISIGSPSAVPVPCASL